MGKASTLVGKTWVVAAVALSMGGCAAKIPAGNELGFASGRDAYADVAPAQVQQVRNDVVVQPRHKVVKGCVAMAPGKKGLKTGTVSSRDSFCNSNEVVFLEALGSEASKGDKRIYFRDGTREFPCYFEQVCEVVTPGLFVGTVQPIYIDNNFIAVVLERAEAPAKPGLPEA